MHREWRLYYALLFTLFALFEHMCVQVTEDPYGIKLPTIKFLPFKKYGFILNFTVAADNARKIKNSHDILTINDAQRHDVVAVMKFVAVDPSEKVVSACGYFQVQQFGKKKYEFVDSSLRAEFAKLPNIVPPLWFYRNIDYELKRGEYISGMTEFTVRVKDQVMKMYTKPFCVMMKPEIGTDKTFQIYS